MKSACDSVMTSLLRCLLEAVVKSKVRLPPVRPISHAPHMASKLARQYGWEDLPPAASRQDAKQSLPRNGGLFVVSHPRHRDSGFCVMNGQASMALCHLPARQRCKRDDVVVCVTPPIEDGRRLLVGWFVITEIIRDVPTYLHIYPRRKDAIYTASAASSGKQPLGTITKTHALKKDRRSWTTRYSNGSKIVFRLKANAKYHRVTPQPYSRTTAWLGAKTLTERKRDFRSRVLLSTRFWRSSSLRLLKHPKLVPRRFCLQWRRRLRSGVFVDDNDFRRWLRQAIRDIAAE